MIGSGCKINYHGNTLQTNGSLLSRLGITPIYRRRCNIQITNNENSLPKSQQLFPSSLEDIGRRYEMKTLPPQNSAHLSVQR
uniref:Uncharacterized protein n=1 Tax=Oryza punctata TaxID=4537 RepID=A0A0E0M3W4_ORYPU